MTQGVAMKEGVEQMSRGAQGSSTCDDRSVIPDWASLLPELVQRIADCVLSTTGGVDAYMDMRAVCPSWRSAIDKPSPLAAVADLRFRPRHWVMVDMNSDDHQDDGRFFLNVLTGRFRRLCIPMLRDHFPVGATDGLLVLRHREPPYCALVLNPFTGDMLHFAAPFPEYLNGGFEFTSVDGGSHSALVWLRRGMVSCVAQTSHVLTENDLAKDFINASMTTIVSFEGNIYCADRDGCVYRFFAPVDQCDDELVLIAQVSPDVDIRVERDVGTQRSFLVVSASAKELLLVRYSHWDQSLKVFRVNVERKLVEEVKSLGSCALFLGDGGCVSVDADKVPSVDGDYIYMLLSQDEHDICVYNLRGDMENCISSEDYLHKPYCLLHVLSWYCFL